MSALTARARAKAEQMMTSVCTVVAPPGDPVTDPSTGQVTRPSTTLYTGPCRVRPLASGLSATSEALGDAETFRFDHRVFIPFSVVNIVEGSRLTVTSSPDPALVGLTMEVQRVDRGDNISARRLMCERMS